MITAIRQQVVYVKTKAFSKKSGQFIESLVSECDAIGFDTDEYWHCYFSHVTQIFIQLVRAKWVHFAILEL